MPGITFFILLDHHRIITSSRAELYGFLAVTSLGLTSDQLLGILHLCTQRTVSNASRLSWEILWKEGERLFLLKVAVSCSHFVSCKLANGQEMDCKEAKLLSSFSSERRV